MARLSKLSRSIAGSVAIVTGAASGMGRATAQLFADEGAKVAAIDLNGADLKKVVGEIEGAGGTVRGWTLDLSDRAAIDRVTAEIAAHFGGIDILVNNAGISIPTLAFTKTFSMAAAALLSVTLGAGADDRLRPWPIVPEHKESDQPFSDLGLSAGDRGRDARQGADDPGFAGHSGGHDLACATVGQRVHAEPE